MSKNRFLPFFKQNIRPKQFIHYILTIISVSGIIGFAIGFTKYFETGYWYLPIIPNALDSAFLILASIYLTYRGLKR